MLRSLPFPVGDLPPTNQQVLDLLFAVARRIPLAAVEVGHEVAFVVHTLCRTSGVRVQDTLGNEGEFGEDRAVPSVVGSRGQLDVQGRRSLNSAHDLFGEREEKKGMVLLHDVFQRMALGLLEVVAAVQRVEPGVEEELGPFSTAQDQASARESLVVLGQDEVNPIAFQMAEGLDHAVRGHNGLVNEHEAL